jgi:hypothetical protein
MSKILNSYRVLNFDRKVIDIEEVLRNFREEFTEANKSQIILQELLRSCMIPDLSQPSTNRPAHYSNQTFSKVVPAQRSSVSVDIEASRSEAKDN